MPRLNFYEQQSRATTPYGSMPRVEIDSGGRALSALGQALESVQGDQDALQQNERRKFEEREAVAANEAIMTVRSRWAEELPKREAAAQGAAEKYALGVLKDFDTEAEDIVKGGQTEASRAYRKQRLGEMRLALQQDALGFEAKRSFQYKLDGLTRSTDAARTAVDFRPQDFDTIAAEQLGAIDAAGLPDDRRQEARQAALERIAQSAVESRIRRDPYGMRKALGDEQTKDSAIRSLPYEARQQARNAAESEIRRREAEARARQAEQRDMLRGDIEDAFAQRQMGLPASLPERSRFVAAYGAEGAARYQAASTRWGAFDAAGDAALLPPAEAAKRLETLKGTGGQEGAADRLQAYDLAVRLYGEQRRALEADPAGVLLRRDSALAAALQAGESDPAALAAYVSKMRGAQEALGLGEKARILPAAYAEAVAQDLEPDPEKPGARAEKLGALAAQWGKAWPTVVREIAPKLEGAARVMVNMRPEAAVRLDAALSQDVQKAAAALPRGEAAAIDERIATELEPFANSLADNLDAESRIGEHASAAKALALSLRLRGIGAADAATQAVQAVVGDQYEFRGLARIPRAYDPDRVMDGAKAAQERALTEPLAILAMPNSDAAAAQRDLKYNVRTSGYWATNADGTGLVLRIPSTRGQGTVRRADGTPVQYTWEELATLETTRGPGPRDARFPERNMAVK